MHGDCRVDLSVIMANWNALEVTATALESIRERTSGIDYEVIVVDNGTTADRSPTELPARFPWAKFLLNAENLGFTRANNQGIRLASGRYVLLLNNDTIQTEDALGESVRYLDAHPEVGALGILHRNNDEQRSIQDSCYSFPSLFGRLSGMFQAGPQAPRPPAVERDVDWVCGSFLMIRRACLEQVGPLDERFFAYFEDVDWCRGAKQAGWSVRFWPGASLIHLGSGAAPYLRDKTGMMYRSEFTYFRKRHSLAAAAIYHAAMSAMLAGGVAKQVVRWASGGGRSDDVRDRWRRLIRFATLRPARAGR